MKRRRKSRYKIFIFLIFLIFLSVYGGFKGGEYLANKLSKPIVDNKGILEEVKSSGKSNQDIVLSENDKVTMTAIVTEFLTAEHMKKDDKLAEVVDKSYYATFIKGIKQLSQGEVSIQDINYKDISKDKTKIEIVFIKGSKKESENIILRKLDGAWKIIQVDR